MVFMARGRDEPGFSAENGFVDQTENVDCCARSREQDAAAKAHDGRMGLDDSLTESGSAMAAK